MSAGPPIATVLTATLEVLGLWSMFSGLGGALYGALALLNGDSREDVANAAAVGVSIGFLVGIGPTLVAAVYVLSS